MAINYNGHRSVLESLYEDKCTVTISRGDKIDEDTLETVPDIETLHFDIPCRLSFGHSRTLNGVMHDESEQDITLFVGPDVVIPTGSQIKVSRASVIMSFGRSGLPKVYMSHREYPVEAWEDVR